MELDFHAVFFEGIFHGHIRARRDQNLPAWGIDEMNCGVEQFI
jgi:hypothetical protein